MPIELPPVRSPPPAVNEPIIEEGNATTSSGLGSPENPILIDMDREEGEADSELGSAQHPIFIEDRDALPQSDDTKSESENGASIDITPSAGDEPALPRGLKARTPQQDGGHFRGGRNATGPPGLQDAGGRDEPAEPAILTDKGRLDSSPPITVQTPGDAPCVDNLIELVATAYKVLPGRDVTLTGEPSARCPSAAGFATAYGEHLPSSQTTTLAEELDCKGSAIGTPK